MISSEGKISTNIFNFFLLTVSILCFKGASEPKNMAYMNRLGLWGAGTAFKEFTDFLQSVEKRCC